MEPVKIGVVPEPDAYWEHFRILTGRYVERKEEGSFFSCSC